MSSATASLQFSLNNTMNGIPIIGWALSLLIAASMAVPFWIFWTVCGIGSRYFYWLPEVYHAVPFWHCVGLFIVCDIIKSCFIPKLASVSQSNGSEKKS